MKCHHQIILLTAVFTAGSFVADAIPSHGKKITFSTAKTIDFENVRHYEDTTKVNSQEYYENHRWVYVTREGMEYTGTLEEVMNFMNPGAAQDFNIPSNPKNEYHPSREDPTRDSQPTEKPGSEPFFQFLSQALDNELEAKAEKRSVIGEDTRVHVTGANFNRFPYNAIGRIEYGCTGTFIAARTILTAGHCVHEGDGGSWVENLNFRRHKDCDPNGGIIHYWNTAATFRGWIDHSYDTYDIALIIVNEVSPVTMAFASANFIALEIINMAGYPGDKFSPATRCLWASSCDLEVVEDKKLRYPCDTAGGMSGSGVYKFWYPSTRIIYGVHAYGVYNGRNSGTRITQTFEAVFRDYINNNDGN